MKSFLKQIGPGPLIAAAFIGPGTVTICSMAGVQFGYGLLWAMIISIVATVVLQEMSARLGLVSKMDLATVLKREIKAGLPRIMSMILVIAAIVIGNAAYEAGNISGGVLGLSGLATDVLPFEPEKTKVLMVWFLGFIAFALLYHGSYKLLEKGLLTLVIFMSLSFFVTAFLTQIDLMALLTGSFVPSMPEGSGLLVVGLIGTTVVPYNLFLHSSLVREKWSGERDLPLAVRDTVVSVVLGGLVSMSVIVSAAGSQLQEIQNASDLAAGLEPLYGKASMYFLSLGLFAAGLTSAITAPLAAALVVSGIFGWTGGMRSKRFRLVWISILLLGLIFSSLDLKPVRIIQFAQVANGILLPLVCAFLLWAMNRGSLLGKYVNNRVQNILGFIILGLAFFLGANALWKISTSLF